MKIKIEYCSLVHGWQVACITENYASPEAAIQRYIDDLGMPRDRVRASVVI